MRNTQQKQAIRAVFTNTGRPLCINEILELAREIISTTNVATIYRNVNQLVADGWLIKVEFPPLGTYYERSGQEHHHYFYCRKCQLVYTIQGCPVTLPSAVPEGFVHEEHELFIRGVCNGCVV